MPHELLVTGTSVQLDPHGRIESPTATHGLRVRATLVAPRVATIVRQERCVTVMTVSRDRRARIKNRVTTPPPSEADLAALPLVRPTRDRPILVRPLLSPRSSESARPPVNTRVIKAGAAWHEKVPSISPAPDKSWATPKVEREPRIHSRTLCRRIDPPRAKQKLPRRSSGPNTLFPATSPRTCVKHSLALRTCARRWSTH